MNYQAVVYQPNSVNSLFVLSNTNLSILLIDVIRATYGEAVDSYVIGTKKDGFDEMLKTIEDEVSSLPNRNTFFPVVALNEYEVGLERYQRLVQYVHPYVDISIMGFEKNVNPANLNKDLQDLFGSFITNLSTFGTIPPK